MKIQTLIGSVGLRGIAQGFVMMKGLEMKIRDIYNDIIRIQVLEKEIEKLKEDYYARHGGWIPPRIYEKTETHKILEQEIEKIKDKEILN